MKRGPGTLLLVHGFTGSRDDFREQMPPPSRRSDARSRSTSADTAAPPTPAIAAHYTLEQLVADLASFADALAPDPFDLLGHSMGGMVALRYALAHPERVASLILMDTAPGPDGGLSARALGARGQGRARGRYGESWHAACASARRPTRSARRRRGGSRPRWEATPTGGAWR